MSTSAGSKGTPDLSKEHVSEGVDLLFSIFQKVRQRLYPRNIMTKQLGRQMRIYDKEQIMYWYERSSYEDCRINAYPAFCSQAEEYDYENGININLLTPNIIFIDLDSENFDSKDDLDKWLQTILNNISSILYGIKPFVLWSGNGYHIIIPVNAPEALEQYEDFQPYAKQPSNEFMRFAKDFLSFGKADTRNSPSFKSCLLRVPSTINAKSVKEEVSMVGVFDMNQKLGNIDRLLTEFLKHSSDYRSDASSRTYSNVDITIRYNERPIVIPYIEKLIYLPIPDHRKFAISLILAPYCINIKRMSVDDSFQIIRQWALESDRMRKLEPSMEYFDRLISGAIKRCAQNPSIKPLNFGNTLKQKNMALYALLL